MSFLKNIFRKKEGGTFVGNLIRGVASNATGGLLGRGNNMIVAGSGGKTVKQLEREAQRLMNSPQEVSQSVVANNMPQYSSGASSALDFIGSAAKVFTDNFEFKVTHGVQSDGKSSVNPLLIGGAVLVAVLLLTNKRR